MVEDEVEEFWDGTDALKGGLVHGEGSGMAVSHWTDERRNGVLHVTCDRVSFSRITACITSSNTSSNLGGHALGSIQEYAQKGHVV